MAIEDTKRLKSTNSENTANELIAQGWTLLLVEPVVSDGEHYARYHLGWQKAGEPAPEFAQAAPLSLGAHAIQP